MATFPPLKITSPSDLPTLKVGIPFSSRFTAEGGEEPTTRTFAVLTGALPTGLTLSAAGALTGTPTTAGAFNFSIRVTDADDNNADATFNTVVLPISGVTPLAPDEPIEIVTSIIENMRVGVPVEVQLIHKGGGLFFEWIILTGQLPAGVTLNGVTGRISGTPTISQHRAVTLRLTNGKTSSDVSFEFDVLPPINEVEAPIEFEMVLDTLWQQVETNVVQAKLIPKQSYPGLVKPTTNLGIQFTDGLFPPVTNWAQIIITVVPRNTL